MDTHCILYIRTYMVREEWPKKKNVYEFLSITQNEEARVCCSTNSLNVAQRMKEKMRQFMLSLNISTSAMNIATTFITLGFCG